MTDRLASHDPTREDLLIQTRWARRLAVVYGAALLLLVAFVAANRVHVQQKAAPDFSRAPAPHVAHAPSVNTRRTD